MTIKDSILAVCRIVGFTLSQDGLNELEAKMAKDSAKKERKKSKAIRAKTGKAKHKTKTPSKTVEDAKKALIANSSPAEIAAAMESAKSQDEFYKNLLDMKRKAP